MRAPGADPASRPVDRYAVRLREALSSLAADSQHLGGCASTKIGFTLSHAERAVKSLFEAVPKVPEGCSGSFWHFWHPVA
jgi:hypothetical protein